MSQQITIKRRTNVSILKAIGILMFVMMLVPLEASVTGSIIAGHAVIAYGLSQGNYFEAALGGWDLYSWFYGIYASTMSAIATAVLLSGGDLIEFFVDVALLADPFTAAFVIGGFIVGM